MDLAQIFPQVLDLELSLCAAVKVQRELEVPSHVLYVTVAGLWFLLAVLAHFQRAIFGFEQKRLRNLNQFIPDSRRIRTEAAQSEDALVASHVF